MYSIEELIQKVVDLEKRVEKLEPKPEKKTKVKAEEKTGEENENPKPNK